MTKNRNVVTNKENHQKHKRCSKKRTKKVYRYEMWIIYNLVRYFTLQLYNSYSVLFSFDDIGVMNVRTLVLFWRQLTIYEYGVLRNTK